MSALMRPRIAVVAAGVAAAIAALHAAEPPEEKFAVGVLRRDGLAIPFATFDGKRWRKEWPEPRQNLDVPATLLSVPSKWWGPLKPLDTWQAWVGQETPRTLQVRQPDWYDAHCVQQVALRTDYRPTQPPPDPKAQPYPKDGLVVSPPHAVERIEVVPSTGVVMPAVVDAFNEAEHKAVRRFEDRGKHPAKEPQRLAAQLKIEAIYASGNAAATRVYYFEASKQYDYPDRFNDDARLGRCGLVSYGAGWFIREGNGPLKPLGFDVAVVPCHRETIRYMLPLGAMRIADRLFWIAQWSGWDYEEYTIVEMKPEKDKTEVALRVWGGGC